MSSNAAGAGIPAQIVVHGGDNPDTFYATSDVDLLDGGGGNDTLYADVQYYDWGQPGHPLLTTLNAGDQFLGGAGDDLLVIRSSLRAEADLTQATIGTDVERLRLDGATARLTADQLAHLTWLTGEFTIVGSGSYDPFGGRLQGGITLGDGNDIASLEGGSGSAYLHGGGGNDILTAGDYADTNAVYGDAGDDQLFAATPGPYGFTGGHLEGGAGNDTLTGNGLDDFLYGGAGADTMSGGDGNDVFYFDYRDAPTEADRIDGGAGNDTIQVFGGFATPWTLDLGAMTISNVERISAPDATVRGTLAQLGQFQSISAGTIQFVGTVDVDVTGLAGISSSRFALDAGGGRLAAGAAATQAFTLVGGAGNDQLAGGGGDDVLLSGAGTDSLSGGAGMDGLAFGAFFGPGDTADGGAGYDTLALQGNYAGASLAGMTNVEILYLASGSDTQFGDLAGNSYDYRLASVDANVAAGQNLLVEAIGLGTSEDLAFDGSAETDGSFSIFAGRGTDDLRGGAGMDGFFFGANGNFTGADHVDGGGGIDTLALRGDYVGANAAVFAAGTIANVEVLALLSGHTNEYSGVIVASGYDYDVTMADGNVAAGQSLQVNAVRLAADETVRFDGRAETDGSFVILSGAGDDMLYGGAGNDTLYGGLGADRMEGGAGADTYLYRSTAESTAASRDTILFGAGDRIDLSAIDADSRTSANDAFAFVGANAFSHVAGELRVFQSGGSWFVEGDTNGDGIADLSIAVITATPLTQADFVL